MNLAKNKNEAIEYFRKAVLFNSKHGKAYNMLG